MEIIIWDEDAERIHRMEAVVQQALQNMHIHAHVSSNCEPPLLARNNIYGKTPALEINGHFWSKTQHRDFTITEVEQLLKIIS